MWSDLIAVKQIKVDCLKILSLLLSEKEKKALSLAIEKKIKLAFKRKQIKQR